MNHPSPDYYTHYVGNPYEQDAKELTQDEIDDETDDMLDRLLANSRRISQLVFDGSASDFNYPETETFFELVSKLMVCPADDRAEYVDDLRNLCERKLRDEAKEMAIQYLEAREVE